jgi:hypothetical protein
MTTASDLKKLEARAAELERLLWRERVVAEREHQIGAMEIQRHVTKARIKPKRHGANGGKKGGKKTPETRRRGIQKRSLRACPIDMEQGARAFDNAARYRGRIPVDIKNTLPPVNAAQADSRMDKGRASYKTAKGTKLLQYCNEAASLARRH